MYVSTICSSVYVIRVAFTIQLTTSKVYLVCIPKKVYFNGKVYFREMGGLLGGLGVYPPQARLGGLPQPGGVGEWVPTVIYVIIVEFYLIIKF